MTIRGDHLKRADIIASEAILAHQPSDTTTQCQSGDAGVGGCASIGSQSIWLRRLDQFTQVHTRLGARRWVMNIYGDSFHSREINDQPSIARRKARKAMTAPAHGDIQIVLPAEFDGALNVIHIHATDDEGWMAVDRPVPDAADSLVLDVSWQNQFAVQRGAQF